MRGQRHQRQVSQPLVRADLTRHVDAAGATALCLRPMRASGEDRRPCGVLETGRRSRLLSGRLTLAPWRRYGGAGVSSPFPELLDVFGCLRRFISLVILAIVAVGAFATRDLWLPRLRSAIGSPATSPARTTSDTTASLPSPADTGWVSVTYPATEKGRRALGRLTQAKGPAFVTLSAGEFAGALLDSIAAQLPASADSVQVRAEGSEFQVRASVRLGDVGGRAVLGPLASMVGDRERLTLGGTLEPTAVQGVAQFRLTRVKVGDFAVPGAVVPRLVKALKRKSTTPGVEISALQVRLPAGVADIRVSQGKITLYRAAP